MTRPILVGYDGSAGAQAAACWTLDEAARTGTVVLQLTVDNVYQPPTQEPVTT
jgi:hypothetical protein